MANRVDRAKWEARLGVLGLAGRLPFVLTTRVVEAVRTHPTGERYMLADGKVPGLALAVYPDGAASWVLQARTLAGRALRCGLGSAAVVVLEAARAEAERLRAIVKAGGDPVAEKRTARAEAHAAEASTVRRYLLDTYEPLVLAHRKDQKGAKDRILHSWEPLLDTPLAQLTRENLEKVIADRKALAKPDGSRLLANATLNREWAVLRSMLADAVRRGQLTALPLATKPEPLRGLQETPRVRWLGEEDTDEQIARGEGERARFFKALDKFGAHEPGGAAFLRCAVRIALNTGIRRGELVRLTDAMVKRGPDRLELPAAICKAGKGRTVYLNPDALAAIQAWQEVRKSLKVQSVAGAMFPGKAERWEDRISQREFPRLCEQAGISGLVFHGLRHTFASLLVKAGVPLIEVRDACGHASILTTEKHYAHLAPNRVQRAVQALRVS